MIEEVADDGSVQTYEVIETEDMPSEDSVGSMTLGYGSRDQTKRSKRFQCEKCPSSFPRQTELNTHKWHVHGIFCSLLIEECPENNCTFTCESKGLMLEHLFFAHSIDVKLISVQLDSEPEFDLWLSKFQYENSSEFVMCTTQSNSKFRTRLYTCVFEAQPKRCDPHKSLRIKRQCAAHLLVKVPRLEGSGKIEVLGSTHHTNHQVMPLPQTSEVAIEDDVAVLPQYASLFEMFQTAEQVIQLTDELKADVYLENPPQEHLVQVEMKLLQLKQILNFYDQPAGLAAAMGEGIEPTEIPSVAESTVIPVTEMTDHGNGQIEIEAHDTSLTDGGVHDQGMHVMSQ